MYVYVCRDRGGVCVYVFVVPKGDFRLLRMNGHVAMFSDEWGTRKSRGMFKNSMEEFPILNYHVTLLLLIDRFFSKTTFTVAQWVTHLSRKSKDVTGRLNKPRDVDKQSSLSLSLMIALRA